MSQLGRLNEEEFTAIFGLDRTGQRIVGKHQREYDDVEGVILGFNTR
jgi:hypothetical protein